MWVYVEQHSFLGSKTLSETSKGTALEQFLTYAHALRGEVDASLEQCTQYNADCPPVLSAAIRHSLLAPGKRFRPILVLLAAEVCGCDRKLAMSAACAVEMIHTYSLIHDDLPAMDDDDLRRGLPTCHVKFGEANAILAGDALLAQAFEVLASGVAPEISGKCCIELARAAGPTMLVGGQVDDLANEFGSGALSDLERIHRRKTGAMILVSLRLGGIIADANHDQLASLDYYGERIGLAFQIIDDWLDVQGDEQAMGKRLRKDSDLGKLTFPKLLGIEQSRQRAEVLVQEAIARISTLGNKSMHLQQLARYLLERNH
jgi:geranylgeranyl diphosphate synthase, type II